MMPVSWAFQTPWEDFFTVVQWDQRGVGKNYLESDVEALVPTMTLERMVEDAEEMVAHLRRRLDKDKIVVMGFSWGSTLGVHLARRRPEWLHAYVGVGQVVGPDAERYLHSRTLELARKDRNQEAVRELEAISPYPGPNGTVPVASALTTRKWARFYNGGWYGKTNLDLFFSLPEWAPEYSQSDLDTQMRATIWATEHLLDVLETGDLREQAREFEVPVFILMGRHDLHVPYKLAREYFEVIQAPRKKFITFERSSTFPMFEESGRFLLALVNEVLPLTDEQAVFEPLARS
jgi:pimeloyl-ACP methyl ester carboxylesterase